MSGDPRDAPEPDGGNAPGSAVVTGASAGIGRDIARELAARGWDVVLTARSEDRLRELADELRSEHGVEAHIAPADLAAPGGPDQVAAAVEGLGVTPDLLVNNAGFGQYGPYLELEGDTEVDQIMVNVVAPTRLVRLLLPGMVERGRGRILNVASTAAFYPGPLMTVYYATKAYLRSYSDGLAEELRDTGVSVTCLFPGPTESRFQERAGMGRSGLFRFSRVMESAEVARAGVDAALAGRRSHVPGVLNKVSAQAHRLAPRGVAARVVKRVQEER